MNFIRVSAIILITPLLSLLFFVSFFLSCIILHILISRYIPDLTAGSDQSLLHFPSIYLSWFTSFNPFILVCFLVLFSFISFRLYEFVYPDIKMHHIHLLNRKKGSGDKSMWVLQNYLGTLGFFSEISSHHLACSPESYFGFLIESSLPSLFFSNSFLSISLTF